MLRSWETERLIVRPLVCDDVNALFPLIYGDPEVVRYFASYTTYAEVEPLHERKVAFNEDPASEGFGHFGVVLKDTQVLIGQVLLGPPEPAMWVVLPESSPAYPVGDEVELGYAFGQAYWGQGFAAEACRVVSAYAFGDLGLRRLVNSVDSRNPRSIRLMERLGFEVEPNLHPDGTRVVGVMTAERYRLG